MLFHGCRYSVRFLSVPEQSNFKYQWIVTCNIYKKECFWRSITSNFVTLRELSYIYWEVIMCASFESTVTNWKWIANGRFEVLWRVHIKFVSARCYRLIDEVLASQRQSKKGCKTNPSSWKRAYLIFTYSCSCNINDDCKNTNYYKKKSLRPVNYPAGMDASQIHLWDVSYIVWEIS